MPRRLVKSGRARLIDGPKKSGAVAMINESNYNVRPNSGYSSYVVNATKSGWACSCPDYARHNTNCKHLCAVQFYRRESQILNALSQAISRTTISHITNKQYQSLKNPYADHRPHNYAFQYLFIYNSVIPSSFLGNIFPRMLDFQYFIAALILYIYQRLGLTFFWELPEYAPFNTQELQGHE